MYINGLKGINNYIQGNQLILILECTADEALAMDTTHVQVATDQGDLAEEYFGYAKQSAMVDAVTGQVTLVCYHDTDGAGAAVTALGEALAAEKQKNADLQAQVEEQALAIEELAAMLAGGE